MIMSTWPSQSLKEVAEDIYTVVHGQGEVGVSNASFVLEEGRAFVIDTMTFPEMAQNMATDIARHGAHVETVLNTHHHIDHMGGNQVFAETNLLAHPITITTAQKLGLPAMIYDHLMPQFRGLFTGRELTMPAPLPMKLRLPQGAELLPFTSAHTPADVAVWLPRTRTLIAGDICFNRVVPLAVNGLISGWQEAIETLIELEPETVVPGHGPIGTLSDLYTLQDYFIRLQILGRTAVEAQISLEDALAELDPGPLGEWLEQKRHEVNLERAMQEARGEISRDFLAVMPASALRHQKQ